MSGEYDYNEVVERIKKECTDGNYRWIDCDGVAAAILREVFPASSAQGADERSLLEAWNLGREWGEINAKNKDNAARWMLDLAALRSRLVKPIGTAGVRLSLRNCDGKKCGADHHPECPHFAEPAQAAPSEEDIHLIGSALFYAIREIRDPALAALDRLRAALASERAKSASLDQSLGQAIDWLDEERAKREGNEDAEAVGLYFCKSMPCSPTDCTGTPCRYLADAIANRNNRPAPDATALRELVDWARGTNHDSAECRMPSQSEVDARIAALASERAKREGEPMRCPSCGCVVDERGHGHHSAADCIFMHSYPAQPNETVLSEADAKLKAIDGSINCYPDKLVLIAKGRYEEYDDLATLLRSEPRGEEPR